MNVFFPGDLALLIGHNKHWDGSLVKITGPYNYFPHAKYYGYPCELVARSAKMMHLGLYPQLTVGASRKIDIGPWSDSLLEKAENFSALCPLCKGSSFCEVTTITELRTFYDCKTHGLCTSLHRSRKVEETEWLTPTSKWAWLSLAPLLTSQPTVQPTLEYPKAAPAEPEPVCTCDVFNFGCACPRLEWETNG